MCNLIREELNINIKCFNGCVHCWIQHWLKWSIFETEIAPLWYIFYLNCTYNTQTAHTFSVFSRSSLAKPVTGLVPSYLFVGNKLVGTEKETVNSWFKHSIMSNYWHPLTLLWSMICHWYLAKEITRPLLHYWTKYCIKSKLMKTYRRQESTPSMEESMRRHIIPSRERASPSACSSVSHWVSIWFKLQL